MKNQRVVRGIRVEEGSGNVYRDLGYADNEGMLVKAQLAAKIAEIIQRRALTQTQAADVLGLTQPRISALLKGRFRGISEHRLECLTGSIVLNLMADRTSAIVMIQISRRDNPAARRFFRERLSSIELYYSHAQRDQ